MAKSQTKKSVPALSNREKFCMEMANYVSKQRALEIVQTLDPLFNVGEKGNMALVRGDRVNKGQVETALGTLLGYKLGFVYPVSFSNPVARPEGMTERVHDGLLEHLFTGMSRDLFEVWSVVSPEEHAHEWGIKVRFPEKFGDAAWELLTRAAYEFVIMPYLASFRASVPFKYGWSNSMADDVGVAVGRFVHQVMTVGGWPRRGMEYLYPMAKLYTSMIPLGPRVGHKETWIVLVS